MSSRTLKKQGLSPAFSILRENFKNNQDVVNFRHIPAKTP